LLGGQIRLMGCTLTTAMWRNRNPVTGQARVTVTPQRPGLSASFNNQDGKPLVFQLNGAHKWRDATMALGFHEALEEAGFGDLGVIVSSEDERARLLHMLDELFATGSRDDWGGETARGRHRCGADQHLVRSVQRLSSMTITSRTHCRRRPPGARSVVSRAMARPNARMD
jgi:hypothetical protein